MFSAFLLSISETFQFSGRLLWSLRTSSALSLPLRFLFFLLVWFIFVVLTASHWLGFLLDEIFFRGYRRTSVKQPVFVLGLPRSGTTWLQRVLAHDQRFTTLTLWECVLAPSISERYFWHFIGILLSPLAWVIKKLSINPLSSFDKIHKLRLDEPEEDFLLLAPLQACFLFVFLCPASNHYWRLSRFDKSFSEHYQQRVLNFYYHCLQKHLYFHERKNNGDQSLRVLSKNPTFTAFIDALVRRFPDANIVACVRNPEQCVPSQLSSVEPALRWLCPRSGHYQFQDNLCNMLRDYYQIIHAHQHDNNLTVIDYANITQSLYQTVSELYQKKWAMKPSQQFLERLQQLDSQGKNYQSEHNYSLTLYSLNKSTVQQTFGHYWQLQAAHT